MRFNLLAFLLLASFLLTACENDINIQSNSLSGPIAGLAGGAAGGGGGGDSSSPLCDVAASGTSNGFQTGDGSVGNPYTICTAAQLNSIGDGFLDKNFLVLKDIDLSGISNFAIIGSGNVAWPPAAPDFIFSGTFDGGGFEISNLTQTSAPLGYYGLIGYLSAAGVVKNVNLVDVNIDSALDDDMFMAGVVAVSFGVVQNSSVTGVINGVGATGGLIGSMEPGSYVSDSNTNANVNGWRAGGLIGFVFEGIIQNSHALGNVTAGRHAGGLIGEAESGYGISPVMVTNCFATGDVTASPASQSAGGLIGSVYGGAVTFFVSKSYATGDVSGEAHVGGFVGKANGDDYGFVRVRNSFSTGNVHAISGFAGGAFGDGYNIILENFYSTGLVTADTVDDDWDPMTPNVPAPSVGVVVGTGDTMNNDYILVFYKQEAGYNDTLSFEGTDAQPWSDIFDRTEAELKTEVGFDNGMGGTFDFDNFWIIDPALNNGYPSLR